MAGSQIAGSTPRWVCADDSQCWQGLDPDTDLDPEPEPEQEPNPSQCCGWPVLTGWACGQIPCVLPHSPSWGYGSKQVTEYFCCGFPQLLPFTKWFQQYMRRYRWAQPCRTAETTHDQRSCSLWALGWHGKPAKAMRNSPQPHSQQNFPICWPASGTYKPFAWCDLLIFSVQTPSAKVQANPEKPPPQRSPGL